MIILDSIFKNRYYFAKKESSSQGHGFPIVRYGFKSWSIKRAECQRIDAFKLWCWRRLLRVPWTSKEIQPIHPMGDQSWVFTGRTDAKAEDPVLWPPDVKN